MPIPIRDQNRGAVRAAAQKDVEVAEFDRQAARISGTSRSGVEQHLSSMSRAASMPSRHHVLPRGLAGVSRPQGQNYLQGRYTYIDLLDAQRSWIRAVRIEKIKALLASHLARVELESLTAAAGVGVDTGASKP